MSEYISTYDQWRLICPKPGAPCDPVLLNAWHQGFLHRQSLVQAEVAAMLKKEADASNGEPEG